MQRLKILFLTPWYPTEENPMTGVFVQEHAKAVQLLHDVIIFHTRGPISSKHKGAWLLKQEDNHNLTHDIPTYRVCHRTYSVGLLSYLNRIRSHFQAIAKLIREGFKPDLIHANIHQISFIAYLLGKYYRIPTVLTEHSSAFPRRLLTRRDIVEARWSLPRLRFVLPVSQALQNGIESYGINTRFKIVPNVVDTNLFYPPQLAPIQRHKITRILFVGSLVPVKGVSFLIEALAKLHSSNQWHLDIIGTGEQESVYRQQAEDLKIAASITWHGYQTKAYVANQMRKTDIFVLASLWENLPCVLLEAQACGLPVVASNIGGIPEIVDAETGLLVPPGDSSALANSIAQVFQGKNLFNRQTISERGKKFSHQEVGRSINEIYEECLK